MISSFKHRGLKRFHERGDVSRINAQHRKRVQNILSVLETAKTIEDIDIPLWRLHPLTGDLQGFWSLTVRSNWRIIFRFEDGDASDVDLVDYH